MEDIIIRLRALTGKGVKLTLRGDAHDLNGAYVRFAAFVDDKRKPENMVISIFRNAKRENLLQAISRAERVIGRWEEHINTTDVYKEIHEEFFGSGNEVADSEK